MYPTAFSEVCRSNDPCKATGNPQPRVQLVQEYESLGQNNNDVMCIATNMIIDNFGMDYTRSDIVRFYCKSNINNYFIYLVYVTLLCRENIWMSYTSHSKVNNCVYIYNHFLVWLTCHHDFTCNKHIIITFSCTLAYLCLPVELYNDLTLFVVNTFHKVPGFMFLVVKMSHSSKMTLRMPSKGWVKIMVQPVINRW